MATFLLTWNPSRWPWLDHTRVVDRLAQGEFPEMPWSLGGSKQARSGDRLFLLRQGVEPRGIVGSGTAVGDAYEDAHFDPAQAGTGGRTTYVRVRFDKLVNADQSLPEVLSANVLNLLIPGLNTSVQNSGTRIDDDLAIAIEVLWSPSRNVRSGRTDDFPAGISREDIADAIQFFDEHGCPPTFRDSTDYDLLHEGRRYPPKAIAGLAARRLRGRFMLSAEFRGGGGTPCFRILESSGFQIVSKQTRPIPFHPCHKYSRGDVMRALGLAETQGGDWATGHHREGDDTFIFANLGVPGRTGHDYQNAWIGDEFRWETKGTLTRESTPVQAMLNPPNGGRVFIFTREHDRDLFTYEGVGVPVRVEGERPVRVVWRLRNDFEAIFVASPGEVVDPTRFIEGAVRQVSVNIYERNPAARRKCIEVHGCRCHVCGFDFEQRYGELGAAFIHVHHLVPLSELNETYEVDPLTDLRPVCPNCHAMLHRRVPPLTIEELKRVVEDVAPRVQGANGQT